MSQVLANCKVFQNSSRSLLLACNLWHKTYKHCGYYLLSHTLNKQTKKQFGHSPSPWTSVMGRPLQNTSRLLKYGEEPRSMTTSFNTCKMIRTNVYVVKSTIQMYWKAKKSSLAKTVVLFHSKPFRRLTQFYKTGPSLHVQDWTGWQNGVNDNICTLTFTPFCRPVQSLCG